MAATFINFVASCRGIVARHQRVCRGVRETNHGIGSVFITQLSFA
jgi:hypothetical protein